jgi:lipopolysaccharide export LptBFGC system permease protein LptF
MIRSSDRYIFVIWWRYFWLCLSLALGILLLEDMYNHLHGLLQKDATLLQIGYYYLLLCPQLSPLVIPIAFFLSLLLALGELRQHNEIIALQVSGISRHRPHSGGSTDWTAQRMERHRQLQTHIQKLLSTLERPHCE